MNKLFGWEPSPETVEALLKTPSVAVNEITTDEVQLIQNSGDSETTILLDAILTLEPDWERGAQKIGDCVGWGFALALDCLVATEIVVGNKPWEWRGRFAVEPCYGGGRVEAKSIPRASWRDGSVGAVTAKWLTEWGALHMRDYSEVTGNPDHDLREYSGKRCKNWGYYGCGGKNDKGALDKVAKDQPVKEAKLVTTYEQAFACIENGYPVIVCSTQGLGQRDTNGFAPPRGRWAHCMTFTGVRRGDNPGLLVTNSWGNSWGTRNSFGKGLADCSDEIKKCSAWVRPHVADKMLGQRDSYALVGIDGLKKREIDFSKGWEI